LLERFPSPGRFGEVPDDVPEVFLLDLVAGPPVLTGVEVGEDGIIVWVSPALIASVNASLIEKSLGNSPELFAFSICAAIKSISSIILAFERSECCLRRASKKGTNSQCSIVASQRRTTSW